MAECTPLVRAKSVLILPCRIDIQRRGRRRSADVLKSILATGLYDISRRRENGGDVMVPDTLTAWRANMGAFSLFALGLTVITLIWARASLVTFALFFSGGMPTLKNFFSQVISADHLDFLLTWFAVGGVFAAVVFAVSVVSVPMMLDRGTDAVVAALTSVRALFANPGPLLLWAGLIVLIVGIGFATLFIGLVIAVPWVGHATWHAYREIVGDGVRDGERQRVTSPTTATGQQARPLPGAAHLDA